MANNPTSRRGRPKGSGIDDAQMLQQIAALLAADGSLRPTTAIHRIGVTDPSVVRRLREKLKAQIPAAPPKAAKPAAGRRHAASPAARSKRVRYAALDAAAVPPSAQVTVATPAAPAVTAEPRKIDPATPDRSEVHKREAELLATYLAVMAAPPKPEEAPIGYPEPKAESPKATQPQPNRSEPKADQPAKPAGFPNSALEGIRLAIEATTAISRLQMHLMQGALKGTPWATMLQGQVMMGQMMLSAFTGALGRVPAHKPDGKK